MKFFLLLLCFSAWFNLATSLAQETLTFAARQWKIRGYGGMPGPNKFSTKNAWVDETGALHLVIRREGDQWTCAEVICEETFQFGTFEFEVEGASSTLDPQAVLGLFLYPKPESGKSGTHEIDIEISRWGNASWPNLNYTVWPAKGGLKAASHTIEAALPITPVIHQFTWSSQQVIFLSRDENREYAAWKFAPSPARAYISDVPQRLVINLWLADGKHPAMDREIEVVIRKFAHRAEKK